MKELVTQACDGWNSWRRCSARYDGGVFSDQAVELEIKVCSFLTKVVVAAKERSDWCICGRRRIRLRFFPQRSSAVRNQGWRYNRVVFSEDHLLCSRCHLADRGVFLHLWRCPAHHCGGGCFQETKVAWKVFFDGLRRWQLVQSETVRFWLIVENHTVNVFFQKNYCSHARMKVTLPYNWSGTAVCWVYSMHFHG